MQLTEDECKQICEELCLPLGSWLSVYHAVMRVGYQRQRPPLSEETQKQQKEYGVENFPHPYVFKQGERGYPWPRT